MGQRWSGILAALAFAGLACGDPKADPADAAAAIDAAGADAVGDANAACDPADEAMAYKLTDGVAADEDGVFFLADDGELHLAFISNRAGGDMATYVTHTVGAEGWDGQTWSTPMPVIDDPMGNLFNFFARTDDGRYHLMGRYGNSAVATTGIVSTLDPSDWGDARAIEPTTPGDFTFTAGSMQQDPTTGEYWLVFISRDSTDFNLYIQRSVDGLVWTGLDGQAATAPTRLTASGDNDFVFSFHITADGTFVLVWQRYAVDEMAPLPYFGASGDIFLMTSDDGVSWSAEQRLTEDGNTPVMDALPWLHERPDGSLWVTWLTRRVDTMGEAFAVVAAAVHPTLDAADLRRVPAPGYSVRSHLLADGRTVLAWVRTFADTDKDYEYRILCDWDFPSAR